MKSVLVILLALVLLPLGPVAALDVAALEGSHWYGLYMNGQKIGYSVNELTVAPDGSVTLVEDATFKMNMVGTKQEMGIYSKRRYTSEGALSSIESSVSDVSGTSRFVATVQGEFLFLSSTVGGETRRQQLPVPKESLRDALKQVELLQENPHIGKAVTFSLFEPMYEMEITGRSEITAIEERFLDGAATKVYEFHTVLDGMGIESVSYTTERGITLEDRIAGGIITMRLEPEEMAKDVKYNNDVIISNAAYVPEAISDPRHRPTLDLHLWGPLKPEQLFNDRRQSLEARDGHFVFQGRNVSSDKFKSVQLPVNDPKVAQWLAPSLFVQSDNPRLVAKAKEIIGAETDAAEVSRLLIRWVYRNVRTTFSARLTNSLEVLDHLEGDCTEHSMLFIGLARAAGLPAREVAGLIYVDNPRPGFYFHQWATVWMGRWIDVDPTFNQPVADATHIKLAEGDLFEQAKLLPIIGQIEITVPGMAAGS